MNATLAQLVQPLTPDWMEQTALVNGAVGRLLVACLLGGVIGIEREYNRQPAGVRTNMLICMGSALFTLLSPILAGDGGNNKGQVASNIVQGIGFLGAGLIIHNRSRISGLASAASVWVVASIGMACGAGFYFTAVVAGGVVVVALQIVGLLERKANLKIYPLIYEARGQDKSQMLQSILDAMDKAGQRLTDIDADVIGSCQRISFPLTTTHRKHAMLHRQLLTEPAIDKLFTFRDPEED
jgi:putative Mg2+ transporter-C (MgtC) family protein